MSKVNGKNEVVKGPACYTYRQDDASVSKPEKMDEELELRSAVAVKAKYFQDA